MDSSRPKRAKRQLFSLSRVLSELDSDHDESSGSEYKEGDEDSDSDSFNDGDESLNEELRELTQEEGNNAASLQDTNNAEDSAERDVPLSLIEEVVEGTEQPVNQVVEDYILQADNPTAKDANPQPENQTKESATPQPDNQTGDDANPQPENQTKEGATSQPDNQTGDDATPQPDNQTGEDATPQPDNQSGDDATPQPDNQTGEDATPQPDNQTGEDATLQPDNQTGDDATPQPDNQTVEDATPQPDNQTGEDATPLPDNQTGENATPQPDKQIGEGANTQPGTSVLTEPTRGRKRKRAENDWTRNQRKAAKNGGREYASAKGVVVPAKTPQPIQCKCPHKCFENFPEDSRKRISEAYWASGDYSRQRDYIVRNVKITERGRSTTAGESRRQNTFHYHLTRNNDSIQVCKNFFLKTLDIKQRTVYYAMNVKAPAGPPGEGFVSPDRRGKNAPRNKTSDADKAFLKAHIESFPSVESHYCRKRTARTYLDSNLNVQKMHEQYEEHCAANGRKPVKINVYREIFNTEYNRGFHRPKKDACSLCDRYKKGTPEQQEAMKAEYEAHQGRKQQAREHKERDKQRAIQDPNVVSINFDLQKVLQTPQMKVSNLYYSRKLATYNFSVYNQASRAAKCYMWHEGLAKRGSNEMASFVFSYMKALSPTVQEINFFSDTCSGQQRNCNFSTMCLYSVQKLPLNIINHKYFESGHSEMEGDSVHSTIERATKDADIYSPAQWFSAVRMSKRTQPRYEVVEVDTPDVIDFKKMANECFTNRKMADDGINLSWLKVKWFQYRADDPSRIYFKYQLDDPEFSMISVNRATRRGRVKDINNAEVLYAYNEPQVISEAKHNDLMKLCRQGHIPSAHHEFYQNLRHHANVRDRLAEPDIEEEEVDSDDE